jgi:transposase-like protein
MQEMGIRRKPPEGSGAAIRVAAAAGERPSRPTKRDYTPEYKQRILAELDELKISGEKGSQGALLRREGLVTTTVHRWRAVVAKAGAKALASGTRGRKPARESNADEMERLRGQVEKLTAELRRAEIIIDVQKKLSLLLGVELPPSPTKKDETP